MVPGGSVLLGGLAGPGGGAAGGVGGEIADRLLYLGSEGRELLRAGTQLLAQLLAELGLSREQISDDLRADRGARAEDRSHLSETGLQAVACHGVVEARKALESPETLLLSFREGREGVLVILHPGFEIETVRHESSSECSSGWVREHCTQACMHCNSPDARTVELPHGLIYCIYCVYARPETKRSCASHTVRLQMPDPEPRRLIRCRDAREQDARRRPGQACRRGDRRLLLDPS